MPSSLPVRRVVVVGGTHGNELAGVQVVDQLAHDKRVWPGVEVRTLVANTEAIRQRRRFIDQDLNRSFRPRDLENPELTNYENRRAREIATELRPGGKPAVDFIVDLHTTTSNMGVSLLLCGASAFELELCAHVATKVPSRIVLLGGLWPDGIPYLKALAPYGLAIEVGPIPQGIVRHDILSLAYDATIAAIEFASLDTLGAKPSGVRSLEIYEAFKNVPYPRQSNGRPMVIHRGLQDRDWSPLEAGQPLFLGLDGTVERCPAEWEGLCPIFVNEAAYYPATAFVLTRRTTVSVPSE